MAGRDSTDFLRDLCYQLFLSKNANQHVGGTTIKAAAHQNRTFRFCYLSITQTKSSYIDLADYK